MSNYQLSPPEKAKIHSWMRRGMTEPVEEHFINDHVQYQARVIAEFCDYQTEFLALAMTGAKQYISHIPADGMNVVSATLTKKSGEKEKLRYINQDIVTGVIDNLIEKIGFKNDGVLERIIDES